jgi:hypothetical protein
MAELLGLVASAAATVERVEANECAGLIAEHGPPMTGDGVQIKKGMKVFTVVDANPYEGPDEWLVEEREVEDFDWIFNHWVIKVHRYGLKPFNSLYATRLAATQRAIELYREQIKEIEGKINELTKDC